MIKTFSRNILNLFVCVFMLSVLVGCRLSYDEVVEREMYCKSVGLEPVRTIALESSVLSVQCKDKDGALFASVYKEQQAK